MITPLHLAWPSEELLTSVSWDLGDCLSGAYSTLPSSIHLPEQRASIINLRGALFLPRLNRESAALMLEIINHRVNLMDESAGQ